MSGLCECGCGQATDLASQSDAKKGHVKGQPYRFRRGHGNGHQLRHQDDLAIAYCTGRIDRRNGRPRRTQRTDDIGRAYARGYDR